MPILRDIPNSTLNFSQVLTNTNANLYTGTSQLLVGQIVFNNFDTTNDAVVTIYCGDNTVRKFSVVSGDLWTREWDPNYGYPLQGPLYIQATPTNAVNATIFGMTKWSS